MKSGTAGFVGERLLEAREARDLSGVALADMVGVARNTISQYERNTQTPRPDVMDRICRVTNLPLAFFIRVPADRRSSIPHYRSLASATKSVRRSAERRHEWLRTIVAWLAEFVDFPVVNLPDFEPPTNPTVIGNEWIETKASDARRFWGLGNGPIQNMTRFLENRGVIVSLSDFGSEDLDAFSERGVGSFEPFVSLSTEKRFAARSNFTAAHELAHLLIHRNVPNNVSRRAVEHKLMERQADIFASCFLLPAESFSIQAQHPSLDNFRVLKAKWRVSIAAMIMRVHDLAIVNDDEFRRMWIMYSKRGWKAAEPFDEELSRVSPMVLRSAFELLLRERIVSREQILEALPYAASDIEALCGLDQGFLSAEQSTVISLPVIRSSGPKRETAGHVIPLRRG